MLGLHLFSSLTLPSNIPPDALPPSTGQVPTLRGRDGGSTPTGSAQSPTTFFPTSSASGFTTLMSAGVTTIKPVQISNTIPSNSFTAVPTMISGGSNGLSTGMFPEFNNLSSFLGISDWYSLHLMAGCEGSYSPSALAPDAQLEVTSCSPMSIGCKPRPEHRPLTPNLSQNLYILASMAWCCFCFF